MNEKVMVRIDGEVIAAETGQSVLQVARATEVTAMSAAYAMWAAALYASEANSEGERKAWEALIKPHLLKVDRRRIPFDWYRGERQKAAEEQRAFIWAGVAPRTV